MQDMRLSVDEGFTAILKHEDYFGYSVANLGVIDGGGDVFVAATAPGDEGGSAYILKLIYDVNDELVITCQSKFSPGLNGFTADLGSNDFFGYASARLQMNLIDSEVQLLVSAPFDDEGYTDDYYGAVYVLFLEEYSSVLSHHKINGLSAQLTADIAELDFFGSSLTDLGIMNGYDYNIAVGVKYYDAVGTNEGMVVILFLQASGEVASFQRITSSLTSNNGDFTAELVNRAFFGHSVAATGDLDRDEVGDLLVGANVNEETGDVYLLFLAQGATVKSFVLFNSGQSTFTADLGLDYNFGLAVASGLDVDKNGCPDLLIGHHGEYFLSGTSHVSNGGIFVMFMERWNEFNYILSHQLISEESGNLTSDLWASGNFGSSTASVGDLDGDGVSELVVGAFMDGYEAYNTGAIFVLFLNRDGLVRSQQRISSPASDENGFFGWSAVGLPTIATGM